MPFETHTRDETPTKRFIRPLSAALWLLAVGCGGVIRFGDLDPPPGRLMVVDVDLEGADALSDGDVEGQIATHADNLSLTGDKPLLDRSKLPTDAKRIESIYAANGYFEARVTDYRVEERPDSTARVVFHVEEGEPTHVETLDFVGIEDSEVQGDGEQEARLREARETIPDLLDTEPGDVWSEERWRSDKEAVRQLLVDEGFVYAEVLGDVVIDRDARTAQATIQIAHGPLTRVAAVEVQGNREIPAERIMRRVGIEPGDIATTDLLRETEVDVYDLGAFFSVTAEPVRPPVDERLQGAPRTFENLEALEWDPLVTVAVTVQEMPIHEVRAGVGVAIDNKRSEANVSGGYQNRNLFGGARYFDASLTPALILLPSFFDPHRVAPGGTAAVVFRQPSVLLEYLQLTVSGDYTLDAELSYQDHTVRGNPMLSYKLFGFLTVFAGYVVELTEYFGFEGGRPSLSLEQTLGLDFREQYLLSMFQQGLIADLRDNVYDPRNGFYGSVTVDESLEAIGSDFHFYRLQGDLRGYVEVASWLVMAARVKAGHVFNDLGTQVPLSARFKGGGPSEMRGFAADRMGPVVCTTGDTQSVTTDDIGCPPGAGEPFYVGGRTLMEGSVEARFYLPANFGLVAFVDVGEVWAQPDDVDLSLLNVAVGPGLRYYTPFGPIRADFALLLTTPEPPAFVFHFSIGQAF